MALATLGLLNVAEPFDQMEKNKVEGFVFFSWPTVLWRGELLSPKLLAGYLANKKDWPNGRISQVNTKTVDKTDN